MFPTNRLSGMDIPLFERSRIPRFDFSEMLLKGSTSCGTHKAPR